ncbi:hypothetical protein SPHINGO8BC_70074 [Sphingobacterium multivorum]|uniref:Uncharacterized protein n=1 Tax=Sphingobacterium multivorum TaxID=28454 RepID=A0A654DVJ2_SPHMU|nr:hypothetical protein SPHINGO8BC_70074 [Sphingobacterium multivorum]
MTAPPTQLYFEYKYATDQKANIDLSQKKPLSRKWDLKNKKPRVGNSELSLAIY